MLRIAHLSDTHVTAPSERLCGLHTPTLLRRALEAVARGEAGGPVDAIVITGDLTHRGEPAAYDEFRRCLDGVTIPVYLGIGNHDRRAAFREAFGGEARYGRGDFVQYAVEDFPGHRLVMLDTAIDGAPAGRLCPARLDWLDRALAADPRTPTLVFLHHPPFRCHIPPLDAIGLDGIEGLAEVIARHPQVTSLHAGHVHRTMSGRLGPVPAVTVPSTCHQSALDLAAPELVVSYEPPGFGLILADDDQILCHTVAFADAATPRLAYGPMRAWPTRD